MKKIPIISAALALCCVFCQSASAEIGYVNYAAALEAAPGVRQAEADFRKEQKKAREEFEKRSAGMDDKGKRELAAKLEKDLMKKRADIQKKVLAPAMEKLQRAIETAAKRSNTDFVVQESAQLYGGKDLTPEVLKLLKDGK